MRNAFYLAKVNGLKNQLLMDEKVLQIPEHIKQKITDEILVTLKGMNASADVTMLQGDCAFNIFKICPTCYVPSFLKLLFGKTSCPFMLKLYQL